MATQPDSDEAKKQFIKSVERKNIANVPVTIATPKDYPVYNDQKDEKILIYLHGGAFTLGSPDHLFQIFAPVAHEATLKTYAIDYPLAPQAPFPKGLNACFDVYKQLLETHDPKNIFFLGDSAGGGLVLSTLLKAQEEKLPMPKAIGLYSPETECAKKGDTYYTLEGRSPKLQYDLSIKPSIDLYVGGNSIKNPLISPIYGKYNKGFPPVMTQSGTRDLILSNSVRLDRELKKQGIQSTLELWDGMWHGFQEILNLPESKEAAKVTSDFFKSHINKK